MLTEWFLAEGGRAGGTDRQTDRQRNIMKIIVPFGNSANSSKNQQFAHTKYELLVFNNDKKQIMLHEINPYPANVENIVSP